MSFFIYCINPVVHKTPILDMGRSFVQCSKEWTEINIYVPVYVKYNKKQDEQKKRQLNFYLVL